MKIIYEPRGKAREYSPLALNIYTGCDHHCGYCYVPSILNKFGNYNTGKPYPRKNLIKDLEKEAKKFSYGEQVLLSFTSDPYCIADVEYQTTREVLKILLKNNVTVAILSKGGRRCLRDLDLFKQFENIKVGATLTFINDSDSKEWEPGAALPEDRIETLRELHNNGIKTWVSLEPVIDPNQTLQLVDKTYDFVDQYKVGKLNHKKNNTDWRKFGIEVIEKLNNYSKDFYVKKDLAEYIPPCLLSKNQTDMNFLSLKPTNLPSLF